MVYPNQECNRIENVLPDLENKPGNFIFLARHGQTDMNKAKVLQGRGINADLNADGIEEAKSLGEFLQNIPFNTVSSSTLRRAVQTASKALENIGVSENLSISTYTELEELSWGVLEGKNITDEPWASMYAETVQAWEQDKSYRPPGGESIRDVADRATKVLKDIAEKGGRFNLVVSHGRALRSILAATVDISSEPPIPNTALYILSWDGSKFSLIS